ncbi:hypothetical protein O2W14_06585 [Modestobacter sp. VKM Ac-2986]|uniref:hypothetical protein n=1 Tax=Modestobacter sp. VKM Ac-2986 TaxID=3004140 RepID=UPI0022AA6EF7|nr:hypothetical protein [Modestobacter sp. VKM Ac-2986]MCZ2828497.1 hypothetical protein [Modestobacter sp. VKM Ac-2986]
MLELGKSASHDLPKGTVPVLEGDAVVATLHASNWKESATAEVAGRSWVFGKAGRELAARWAVDPEDAVRLRARQTSYWNGTWTAELDGMTVEVTSASRWKGTHRYTVDGRQLAESDTTGSWNPRPTLTTAPDLSLDHAVFLLWVELVLGRRWAAAAAAV